MKKILQVFKAKLGRADDHPQIADTIVSQAFSDLGLIQDLQRAVTEEGYSTPTPIQLQSIPIVLKGGDLLGCAQTGTGKTAAFALPILQRLFEDPEPPKGIRALVLSPTRELALQIAESFTNYGRHLRLKTIVVFGGVGVEPQKQALRRRPDILVATPGRLLDLMGQGYIDLKSLSVFVLDEADRMLDMGFIHDVNRIVKVLPARRQTLLFSATMPPEIQKLAMRILHQPAKVEVTPVSSTNEQISQSVYFVDRSNKRQLLLHVLEKESMARALVFTRTKSGANRVAEFLCKAGIKSEAIHGNKSQSARQRALENFKAGSTRVLVASDLAARGLDVDAISHVINFDLPDVAETYVHRIGRTGRAQATGSALAFCEAADRSNLKAIEKLVRQQINIVEDHPFPAKESESTQNPPPRGRQPMRRRPSQPGRSQQRSTNSSSENKASSNSRRPRPNH